MVLRARVPLSRLLGELILLVDMDKLFEQFVAAWLREYLDDPWDGARSDLPTSTRPGLFASNPISY